MSKYELGVWHTLRALVVVIWLGGVLWWGIALQAKVLDLEDSLARVRYELHTYKGGYSDW